MRHFKRLFAALLGLVLMACGPGGLEEALGDATAPMTMSTPAQAAYDSVLKAPRCEGAVSSCDSGSLLNGRGPVGPESHAPNTINDSCLDGAVGIYHEDESIDRIRVATVDGTALAAGKTARIDVTIWAWSTVGDSLDLFYASDASNPSWTYLTTIIPTVTGAQVLSATYVLPSGSLQAVRGNLRYSGSPSTCTTDPVWSNWDDRDDLVFAVGPMPPAASFTYACKELSCSFTDASTDPDGIITSRSWSFGDGSGSTLQGPSHTYAAGDTYKVSLMVTDSQGLTSTAFQSITVWPRSVYLPGP